MSPVATPCTSYGFAVDATGDLTLDGPRPLAWIGGSTCPIDSNNGLKYDPATGKLWVAPADTVATQTTTRGDSVIGMTAGTTGSNHDLGGFSISQTCRICTPSLWTCYGFNNYAHFTMANGNDWRLIRTMILVYNSTSLGTAQESIMEVESGAGAGQALGIGMPGPAFFFQVPIQNGDTITLTVSYLLAVDLHTDSNTNAFVMRWPTMQGIMWSHA